MKEFSKYTNRDYIKIPNCADNNFHFPTERLTNLHMNCFSWCEITKEKIFY